jgi:putrescine importer
VVLAQMVTFGGLFGFMCVNFSAFFHFYVRKGDRRFFAHLLFPFIGVTTYGYILFNFSEVGQIVGFSWMGLGVVYLVIRSALSSSFKHLLEKNSLINPDLNELEDSIVVSKS